MTEYKIKNKLTPVPLDSVRLLGYEGDIINTFIEGRIFSDYARTEVYPEAEDAFKYCVDGESPVGIWQGEYWGKWMISAARVARYTHSEELRAFIGKGARKLIGYQRADGYLGTYKNSSQLFPPTEEEAFLATGQKNLWNWNVWCRKYTLWGMLECYMLLNDSKMLRSCIGMADYLIDELEQLDVELGETGTFAGVASCSILKPMLILYRLTEDRKYLDFAKRIAERWENRDIKPGLIANAVSGKRIREWYKDSNKWAKAYETMSCFDGIIELYRVTGEKKYLHAAECYYDLLVEHEYNLLFSVGFNDVFGDAAYDLNVCTEPCDVIHFMRLCHELFLLTKDAKYMDKLELAASTPLLASAFKDGKWGARALRGQGRHLVAIKQALFTKNHCCVNNMPRGLMNFAESAVMTYKDAIYVNLYSPLEAEITVGDKKAKVSILGEYLSDCKATIKIEFDSEPLPVKLRIPEWSKKSEVRHGNSVYTPKAGYLTLVPSEKKTTIELSLDDTIRVVKVRSHEELGDNEWKRDRWVSATFGGTGKEYASADPNLFIDGEACVLIRGASMLCRSKLIGNTEEEMFGERKLSEAYRCTKCERIHTVESVNTELLLTFSDGENTLEYHVADYASATNFMTDDKRYFSIYF